MAVARVVDEIGERTLEVARELLEQGAPFQAIRTLRGLANADSDPELRLCLASAYIELGRDREAAPIVEPLLAELDEVGPQRAMVLATAAHLRSVLGDPDGARALAQQAIDANGGAGAAAALGLLAVSRGYMFDGDVRRGLRWAHRATDAAASAGPRALVKARLHEAYLLMHNDRFVDAERMAASTVDVPGADNARLATLRRIVLGAIRFHSGQWSGLDRLLDPRPDIEGGVEIGDQEWATSAGILAVLLVHADRLDEATELVTQGAHVLATGQRPMLLWGGLLLADARGDTGLTELMADRLIAALEGLRSQGRLQFVGPDLVRILLGLDDRPRAAAVTVALERLAVHALPSIVAVARLCRGILDRDADALRVAANEFERAGRPLEQATALEVLAIDATAGRSGEAVTSGRAALALYERVGARRDARRLAASLRARGIAAGRRGPRSRSSVGWAALSPTEQRVASLVAEGLTNGGIASRLAISDRTVETHVSHILNKLALPSRSAIAATAARRAEAD